MQPVKKTFGIQGALADKFRQLLMEHHDISFSQASLLLCAWAKSTLKSYLYGWKFLEGLLEKNNIELASLTGVRLFQILSKLVLAEEIPLGKVALVRTILGSLGSLLRLDFQLEDPLLLGLFRATAKLSPKNPRYSDVFDAGSLMKLLPQFVSEDGHSEKIIRDCAIMAISLSAGLRAKHLEHMHIVKKAGKDVIFFLSSTKMNQGIAKCSCKKVVKCVGGDWRACPACLLVRYLELVGFQARKKLHMARLQDMIESGIPKATVKAIDLWYPTFIFLDHSGWLGASSISAIKKRIMARAGVDTEVFKPHATRAAAATFKVQRGVPIEQVAVEGDWGGLACLDKYYIKDVVVESRTLSVNRELNRSTLMPL